MGLKDWLANRETIKDLKQENESLKEEIKQLNEAHKQDLKNLVRIERTANDEHYKVIAAYKETLEGKTYQLENKPKELNKTQTLMAQYFNEIKKKPKTYSEFMVMFNKKYNMSLSESSVISNVSHIRKAGYEIPLKR